MEFLCKYDAFQSTWFGELIFMPNILYRPRQSLLQHQFYANKSH